MDGVGAVVAAGSTDAIVRVWDARDPSGCAKPAFKLKLSHTGPHTTALAWLTPILNDFSRRISPLIPRFQYPPSAPFNSI